MNDSTRDLARTAPSTALSEKSIPSQVNNDHAHRLWLSLPDEVARRFRPHADTLAMKILEAIKHGAPEYAKQLDGGFGRAVTQAIKHAVLGCVDSIGGRSPAQHKWAEVFREVGSAVYQGGGSLDSLHACYRVGGQAAWRYVAAWGQRAHLSVPMLCVSAEAIFALIDEISSYSVEGYTLAQAKATDTLEQQRQRLLELILATPQSSPQTIATMAKAVNWTIPEWVTVVALEAPEDQQGAGPTFPVHADMLADFEGAQPCLVTANAEHDLRRLEPALRGWRAAIGPRVRLADTGISLRWACWTLQLMRSRIIDTGPVARSCDHLSTLWFMHDDFFLSEITRKALGPLYSRTPKQQTRLAATLLAWLECQGSTPEVANRLKIHPQTVRYRLNQLVDLFGSRLDDPLDRLEMQIALHAHRLRGPRSLHAVDVIGA